MMTKGPLPGRTGPLLVIPVHKSTAALFTIHFHADKQAAVHTTPGVTARVQSCTRHTLAHAAAAAAFCFTLAAAAATSRCCCYCTKSCRLCVSTAEVACCHTFAALLPPVANGLLPATPAAGPQSQTAVAAVRVSAADANLPAPAVAT
jgi:hypothetical protein